MSVNYLIIGDDEYIKEREVTGIKNQILESEETNLNYSVHLPDDINGIMDSVGTVPFLSKKRVVVVKEFQNLCEKDQETILGYLDAPSESCVLILMSDNSFKKNKAYKKLSSKLKTVKADNPDVGTIKNWIRSFYKRKNIQISSEAVDLIVELKGTDTISIKNELDKLENFSDGGKIKIEHVEELVGRSVAETVFKLVDAINVRDTVWIFSILEDLYDQKKQPQEIIGYLGWYIRVMQKIVLLKSKGASPEETALALGYSPGYTRRLSVQSKKYSVKRIEQWTNDLFETDKNIKTGRVYSKLAMETLMISLMGD
ncbi:MAG: DNA polymerase III subunit delta [Candidatus Omnitrophica bacterium]|nr:DNA polymerase III subunit delta [Candidatus Omnitrophota bacterium]